MNWSVLGILTASLLGSVHCAAMCGGFVCFYSGAATERTWDMRGHVAYNAGRLASYLLLGALAGAIGVGVTRLGALAGVGRAASVVAGMLMVGWALATFAAQRGVRIRVTGVPLHWQHLVGGLLVRLRDQPLAVRAGVTGLVTTLLPCGWLYVFVAAAGATGVPVDAMLLMAVFWLGTLPAMIGVGVGAQRALGPLRKRLPSLSAVAVLAIGILTITGHLVMTAGIPGVMSHGR